ncbi:MAG: CHAD domain-containing protein [Ktedonobacteraceae bacterium]
MAKAKPIMGLVAQAPTGVNARVIVKERLEEMYAWDKYVDHPYSVHELHNLRIAAKRLRYTFEVFEDFLPEKCKAIVAEIAQVQDEVGALHDSDVMIALLRLCLESQDSGVAYEQALVEVEKQGSKKEALVPPAMVADLVDPGVAPIAEERYGLEEMLLKQQQMREERYVAFRQHWYQLQARDFRREILEILDG